MPGVKDRKFEQLFRYHEKQANRDYVNFKEIQNGMARPEKEAQLTKIQGGGPAPGRP